MITVIMLTCLFFILTLSHNFIWRLDACIYITVFLLSSQLPWVLVPLILIFLYPFQLNDYSPWETGKSEIRVDWTCFISATDKTISPNPRGQTEKSSHQRYATSLRQLQIKSQNSRLSTYSIGTTRIKVLSFHIFLLMFSPQYLLL